MQMISLTNLSQAKLNFASRRANFASRPSPLNPLTRASASTHHHQTESTKTHLSNLEKLLQKQAPPPPHENNKGNSIKYSNNRGRLWDGLDLARIWPEMKAAEDMSPRNLNHLQRLLSGKGPQYSPRNDLGHKWREYHGCNDWEGLLDPLDENLRREVVRYGEFVQAAYYAFHSNPTTTSSTSLSRHVALPDRSYKVTKSLYATSSVGLPGWMDDVAPALGWMTQRSSWIGYVAVCDDTREIARMGRRDIVIALRGTATCLEWVENLRDILVRFPSQSHEGRATIAQQAKVECGFLSLYKTAGVSSTRGGSAVIPSLAESLVNEIVRLLQLYKGENLSITVTGHSLGAALALLAADELSTCIKRNIDGQVPPIAVYSFGGPRVGNRGFATRLTNNGVKVLRVVNSQDVITRVPGMFVSEGVERKLRDMKAAGLLDALDNNMPWAYSHVGKELRVDSKMSPYLKPNADVACCHDLEAYLHLVDGFLSSNCPYRENAKRSLVRLVHEQGSNVKKLYTSKAKALSINLNREQAAAAQIQSCLPSPS